MQQSLAWQRHTLVPKPKVRIRPRSCASLVGPQPAVGRRRLGGRDEGFVRGGAARGGRPGEPFTWVARRVQLLEHEPRMEPDLQPAAAQQLGAVPKVDVGEAVAAHLRVHRRAASDELDQCQ